MFELIVILCHFANSYSVDLDCTRLEVHKTDDCFKTLQDIREAHAGEVKEFTCKKKPNHSNINQRTERGGYAMT